MIIGQNAKVKYIVIFEYLYYKISLYRILVITAIKYVYFVLENLIMTIKMQTTMTKYGVHMIKIFIWYKLNIAIFLRLNFFYGKRQGKRVYGSPDVKF